DARPLRSHRLPGAGVRGARHLGALAGDEQAHARPRGPGRPRPRRFDAPRRLAALAALPRVPLEGPRARQARPAHRPGSHGTNPLDRAGLDHLRPASALASGDEDTRRRGQPPPPTALVAVVYGLGVFGWMNLRLEQNKQAWTVIGLLSLALSVVYLPAQVGKLSSIKHTMNREARDYADLKLVGNSPAVRARFRQC